MNDFRISTASRNLQADALATSLDGGSLRIYSGDKPASPNTAVTTQTLLAELTFGTPAFGSASGGTITANAITSDNSANASGEAAWYRCVTSALATVCDGTVGTSGADLNLGSVNVQQGGEVAVSSFTITVPEGP